MPDYVLSKISDALTDIGKPLKGSTILLLGVAYKAGVADLRESPALDLIHLLQVKGAAVLYNDPYVPHLDTGELNLTSTPLDNATLQSVDCLVITTAHSDYNWQRIADHTRLVVDTRNAMQHVTPTAAKIVKI